ncbi:MAG: hypothetical protein IJP18_04210 [Oscillospiraceae bacterium]|nr:hypothetical protein [Oscillospiraceae bacterium]
MQGARYGNNPVGCYHLLTIIHSRKGSGSGSEFGADVLQEPDMFRNCSRSDVGGSGSASGVPRYIIDVVLFKKEKK